jgi:hypothetical protein
VLSSTVLVEIETTAVGMRASDVGATPCCSSAALPGAGAAICCVASR